MSIVLAIDPGSTQSGWVALDTADGSLIDFGNIDNLTLLGLVRNIESLTPTPLKGVAVVIEQVASYGMAVGRDIFETVYWSGRFAEAADPLPVDRITRGDVKLHLCGSRRAKDSNVRQALIDRYGGVGGKEAAVGRKAAPGPLYGVSKDVWSALAVAVCWADQRGGEK